MYIIQQVKPWLNSTALDPGFFVTNSLIVRLRRSFFFAFCVLNFVFSLVATLANLLIIRALMKASTLPANVKKMLNCKKEENWDEAKRKRDDTFFSSPSPLFSLFRPSDNQWIAISTLPIFICQKKKLKMADNSLLTKDTWPIAWACALEVDRRMPGEEVVAYNCMHVSI